MKIIISTIIFILIITSSTFSLEKKEPITFNVKEFLQVKTNSIFDLPEGIYKIILVKPNNSSPINLRVIEFEMNHNHGIAICYPDLPPFTILENNSDFDSTLFEYGFSKNDYLEFVFSNNLYINIDKIIAFTSNLISTLINKPVSSNELDLNELVETDDLQKIKEGLLYNNELDIYLVRYKSMADFKYIFIPGKLLRTKILKAPPPPLKD